MLCDWCQRPIDTDKDLNDGYVGLCEECARMHSNQLYNKLLSVFEAEDDLTRMAFAKYGIDDFAYCVDEELRK